MANTTAVGHGCHSCIAFFTLLGVIVAGLIGLVVWLCLTTSNPSCSLEDFTLIPFPAGKNSTNGTTTTYPIIYFDLKIENQEKGSYYDSLNLTFYRLPDLTTTVASISYPGFYQNSDETTHKKDWVEADGLPWTEGVFLNRSGAVFRLDLETAVRFQMTGWKTRRHRLAIGADIAVNGLGMKVDTGGIRLRSGAPARGYPALPICFSTCLVLGLVFIIGIY